MSLNLFCDGLDLWQTPTDVTLMCLMTKDGPQWALRGGAAVRALKCYMEWVKGQADGKWEDPVARQSLQSSISNEVAKITSYLAQTPSRRVNVYMM